MATIVNSLAYWANGNVTSANEYYEFIQNNI